MPHVDSIPTYFQSIPALIISACNTSGTGFCIRHAGHFYLITASHVIFDSNGQLSCDRLEYSLWLQDPVSQSVSGRGTWSIDLPTLGNANIINIVGKDLAALRVGQVTTMDGPGQIGYFNGVTTNPIEGSGTIIVNDQSGTTPYDELKIGNEAFTIGYPLSLGLSQNAQFDYQRPLLRKGIIAGKNANARTVILDCPVYQGNSGGPVVEIYRCGEHCRKNHFTLFGVVSEFIPFTETWTNQRYGNQQITIQNSGYSVVTPLDTFFNLIDTQLHSQNVVQSPVLPGIPS